MHVPTNHCGTPFLTSVMDATEGFIKSEEKKHTHTKKQEPGCFELSIPTSVLRTSVRSFAPSRLRYQSRNAFKAIGHVFITEHRGIYHPISMELSALANVYER